MMALLCPGSGSEAVDVAPKRSARAAGLRYASDAEPGIRRRRRGRGFQYLTSGGRTLTDTAQLARIRGLAIPPAWTDVWICPSDNGHLQATGRDARGRKQYRYHPRWREVRDATKYHRMLAFGAALPKIRRRVDKDLSRHALSREKVVAAVVRLLDTTTIRVGNDEYARENGSFGLTTMRERHVDSPGRRSRFGSAARAARCMTSSSPTRASPVFSSGARTSPDSASFSTWETMASRRRSTPMTSTPISARSRATTSRPRISVPGQAPCSPLGRWRILGGYDSKTEAKRQIVSAVESVSGELGNTPAVCRRCYVHPDVLDAHLDGTLQSVLEREARHKLSKGLAGLSRHEAAVLALLTRRLAGDG